MSTIKVNSIEPANAGSEDYFLARAWVNFNGTGTVAIRNDGNVTSITDNGTGNYTVNFTNALSSADYAAPREVDYDGVAGSGAMTTSEIWSVSASAIQIAALGGSTLYDCVRVDLTVTL